MAKSKEIIIAGINDKKINKELSDITISDDFKVDDLMDVTSDSGKRAKKRATESLVTLRERIIAQQFESYQLKRKYKICKKQLEQHPTVIALKKLNKQIRESEKQIEAYAAYYQGGFETVRAAGIDVDPKIMKALNEAIGRGK
jgi:hypothetical protein